MPAVRRPRFCRRLGPLAIGLALSGQALLLHAAEDGAAQAQAALVEQSDGQCLLNDGALVVLRRRELATAEQGVLQVWVERWFLGVKTADRTRHLLPAGGAPVPLGCSRTADGEQHWEIVAVRLLPP